MGVLFISVSGHSDSEVGNVGRKLRVKGVQSQLLLSELKISIW